MEVYEFRLTGVEGSVARFAVECGRERTFARWRTIWASCKARRASRGNCRARPWASSRSIRRRALAELEEDAKAGKIAERVIRLENMLPELPRATVLPIVEKRVRHGAKFNLSIAQIQPGHAVAAQGAPAAA